MTDLTVVNYHYIRDSRDSLYPGIKARSINNFRAQLDQLAEQFNFVTADEVIKSLHDESSLPKNSCWLTFDDGYVDHYNSVFPILLERGIQGTFFPVASTIVEPHVLDVNKIQFLVASEDLAVRIVEIIKQSLLDYQQEYELLSFEEYWNKWAAVSRFGDSKEVTFVKRMLQLDLPVLLRQKLVSSLFSQFVTDDEGSFAVELYMTQQQLQEMRHAGMYVGYHGYHHKWLNYLSAVEQLKELESGLHVLRQFDLIEDQWLFSYPFGGWDDSLISQAKSLGCVAGMTVNPGVVDIKSDNRFLLNRFDTTDIAIKSKPKLSVMYGLPSKVKFCSRCVISNQRPNSEVEFHHTRYTSKKTIHLDEDGVCDACRTTRRKKLEIDWEERDRQLVDLCNRHRKNGQTYDCLVPGSGGKDSFFAAHTLKNKYGMRPLTVTWAPHMYTEWGWNNFQAWVGAGFDNYLITPNGRTHRLLTRLALENLFHPFQPFMLGQKALAPRIAALFNIPLVFYGENEAEYGNPIQDAEAAERDWKYYAGVDPSEIYLGGVSIKDLQNEFGIQPVDLESYQPIDPQLFLDKNIEVHYLGYYLRWHPQGAYYYAVENGGFQPSPERTPGTYSKYNSIDDKIDDLHYYTTYIKFGIGRATYDAAQEIRNEEITREEGIALVKKYDGEYPDRFEKDVFRYLSIPSKEFEIASKQFSHPIMDRDYFDRLAESFRSPHLWQKKSNQWHLRRAVWRDDD